MKIPDLIETSPELRKEQQLYADLIAREKEVSAKVRELRNIKENGLALETRASRAELVLAGQPLPDDANVDAELATAMLNWRAIEDAKEIQLRHIEDTRRDAGRKLSQSLKPQHEKLMTALCIALTDAHAAWRELFTIKRGLLGQGIGLSGLFSVDPQEFMGVPSDRASDFCEFMRDAARAGYCRELPR